MKASDINARRPKKAARMARKEASPVDRRLQESLFADIQTVLMRERLESEWRPGVEEHIRAAARDAAAIAWLTPFPTFVYPGLFDEKADAAIERLERQKAVRQRSLELLSL